MDYRSARRSLAHSLAGVGAGGNGVSFGTTAPDYGRKVQGARQGFSPIGIGRGRYIKAPINSTPFFRDPEATPPVQGQAPPGAPGGPTTDSADPNTSDSAAPTSPIVPVNDAQSMNTYANANPEVAGMNLAMPDPNDPSTWYWYDSRAQNPLLMQ